MRFIILLYCIFCVSCVITNERGRSRGYTSKLRQERISDIVGKGRLVEHKNFSDWNNHYLDDIKFDIFMDSSGSRIGVESVENANKSILRKASNISLDGQLAIIENSLPKWNKNMVVNSFLVLMNRENVLRNLNDYNASNNDNVNEQVDNLSDDDMDGIPERNHLTGKVIGSNRFVRLILKDFNALKNWKKDNLVDGLSSFVRSCDVFANGGRDLKTKNLYIGSYEKWYKACKGIGDLHREGKIKNNFYIRKYFEKYFIPVQILHGSMNKYSNQGTFTGYYELDLDGSKEETNEYKYAIYGMPSECKNNKCITSKNIFNGKLRGRNLELYWVKDPLELFFMQIQGSGIVNFEDGSFARVGYAGTNKRSVSNVFSYMKRKCIPNCNPSLVEIKAWFKDNPDRGLDVLAQSESYVFFRKLENNGDGAIGAQGVPLTPSRSMAVDNEFIPYGIPIWLETNIAVKRLDGTYLSLERLLVAQDTGGAINGPIRGDIFFGHGTKARYLADKQKFNGSYFILVPRDVIKDIKVY